MKSKLDLVYIVDISPKTIDRLLEQVKGFIERDLESYTIGSTDTRVSIIAYDSISKVMLQLHNGVFKNQIKNVVDQISSDMTIEYLDAATESTNLNANVFMSNAVPFFIVFGTDDQKAKQMLAKVKATNSLNTDNLEVILVGMGDRFDKKIVRESVKDETNIFLVDHDQSVDDYVAAIKMAVSLASGNFLKTS